MGLRELGFDPEQQLRDQTISDILRESNSLPCEWLGTRCYQEVRAIQNKAVRDLQAGEGSEVVFLCEHSPTLTLGPRTKDEHLYLQDSEFIARGVELVEVDRGGGASFHGFGQLMVYPVLSLRRRKYGVKDFVFKGLELLAATASDLGVCCSAELEPPGVWVGESSGNCEKKLLSVGLRIERGVSNHGYCLNVSADLEMFTLFTPCGQPDVRMTSIANELGRNSVEFSQVVSSFIKNSGDFWGLQV